MGLKTHLQAWTLDDGIDGDLNDAAVKGTGFQQMKGGSVERLAITHHIVSLSV